MEGMSGLKDCIRCAESKPIGRFPRGRNVCLDCRAAARRQKYAADAEYRRREIARAKANSDKRHHSKAHRERWRRYKRNYRRRLGAERQKDRETRAEARRLEAAAIRAGRQAWREWLHVLAPDSWVRSYYEASGKPWNNPRLTSSEAWVLRYRLDEQFRARQLARMARRKRQRRELERGGISRHQAAEIRAQASSCSYCGKALDHEGTHGPDSATLDHVVPLSRGGPHERSNVRPACLSCNSRKQDRINWPLAAELC